MKASELMSSPVIVARADATLGEIAQLMLERVISCVPIVNAQGRLVGLVSELDFGPISRPFPFSNIWHPLVFRRWMPGVHAEQLYGNAAGACAQEIMESNYVATVTEEEPIETVPKLLLDHRVHGVPVVRDGRPVGIITRHDMIRMMTRKGKQLQSSRSTQGHDQNTWPSEASV